MIQPTPDITTTDPRFPIVLDPTHDGEARNTSAGCHKPTDDPSAAQASEALAAAAVGRAGSSDGESDADTATLCRLLSLLADKTRLRILWLLTRGERAVGAMTAELRLPQPTVSHHLAWLRTMHLVAPRRAGKNVFYALGRAARAEADGSLSLLTADSVVTIARRTEADGAPIGGREKF